MMQPLSRSSITLRSVVASKPSRLMPFIPSERRRLAAAACPSVHERGTYNAGTRSLMCLEKCVAAGCLLQIATLCVCLPDPTSGGSRCPSFWGRQFAAVIDNKAESHRKRAKWRGSREDRCPGLARPCGVLPPSVTHHCRCIPYVCTVHVLSVCHRQTWPRLTRPSSTSQRRSARRYHDLTTSADGASQ